MPYSLFVCYRFGLVLASLQNPPAISFFTNRWMFAVGFFQSVPSPNVVRLWAMVLLIGGERGQEDQKWQIIQTGLQTADFYVIKMCQN